MEIQLDLFGEPVPPPPPPPIVVASYVRRRAHTAPRPRPEKSGTALRDEALEKMEQERGEWLKNARNTALVSAADNGGLVSADDIRIPLPTGASPNLRGAIFKSVWFRHFDYVPSTMPSRHANRISRWALTEEGRKALRELVQ